MSADPEDVAAVERALVRIRRLQQRRTLARISEQRTGTRVDPTLTAVVDAVEQHAALGSPCTVSSIAEALAVDQPRASRLVARAVEEGLVARTPDQSDGRRLLLALTASGAGHAARVHRFRQAVAAEAMADWSPRQAATFARLLTRFVDSFAALAAQDFRTG